METEIVARGVHSLSPYMIVDGASRLLDFFQEAFGARQLQREDRPGGGILHAELALGDSLIELSEARPEYPAWPVMMHHYSDDADTVYRRALQAGAVSVQEPIDQDYGDREAGVKDPSGNYWWIATRKGVGGVPAGFHALTMYLNVARAAALAEFTKHAFDATIEGDSRHRVVRIGNAVLEVSEAHDPYPAMPGRIRLFVDNADATYRRALDHGAVGVADPEDKPYGERGATIQDASGNIWFIATLL